MKSRTITAPSGLAIGFNSAASFMNFFVIISFQLTWPGRTGGAKRRPCAAAWLKAIQSLPPRDMCN